MTDKKIVFSLSPTKGVSPLEIEVKIQIPDELISEKSDFVVSWGDGSDPERSEGFLMTSTLKNSHTYRNYGNNSLNPIVRIMGSIGKEGLSFTQQVKVLPEVKVDWKLEEEKLSPKISFLLADSRTLVEITLDWGDGSEDWNYEGSIEDIPSPPTHTYINEGGLPSRKNPKLTLKIDGEESVFEGEVVIPGQGIQQTHRSSRQRQSGNLNVRPDPSPAPTGTPSSSGRNPPVTPQNTATSNPSLDPVTPDRPQRGFWGFLQWLLQFLGGAGKGLGDFLKEVNLAGISLLLEEIAEAITLIRGNSGGSGGNQTAQKPEWFQWAGPFGGIVFFVYQLVRIIFLVLLALILIVLSPFLLGIFLSFVCSWTGITWFVVPTFFIISLLLEKFMKGKIVKILSGLMIAWTILTVVVETTRMGIPLGAILIFVGGVGSLILTLIYDNAQDRA